MGTDTVDAWAGSPVLTVGADASLGTARTLMLARGIQHLVVVEGTRAVGLLSDRDVLGALSPVATNAKVARQSDVATLNKRVHQVMSHKLVTVPPGTPMTEAMLLLARSGVHCLPVVEGERAVGILTTSDVLRYALERLGHVEPARDAA